MTELLWLDFKLDSDSDFTSISFLLRFSGLSKMVMSREWGSFSSNILLFSRVSGVNRYYLVFMGEFLSDSSMSDGITFANES